MVFLNPGLIRLIKVWAWIGVLIAVGTVGYMVVEGWSALDSLFMTVITVSTVGYGIEHEMSSVGRWFTTALIFLFVVSMTWWTATLTSVILEIDLRGNYIRRRILKMIGQLKDHTIVCGAGRMSQAIIDRLMRKNQSVVVVDPDKEKLEALRQRYRRLLTVEGRATDELTLCNANLLEASHVVAATDSEVDNLLIAITCKDLGRNVAVYARSNDVTIANRMRKAGVDEVISPSQLCGNRVSALIMDDAPTEVSVAGV